MLLESLGYKLRDPYWKHKMGIQITTSKEEALLEESEDVVVTKVYSDSSGLEGCIGAAVVMYQSQADGTPTIQSCLQKCRGSNDKQMVYMAKQSRELMSLEML